MDLGYRCLTGISGLDTLLNGGIPRGNSVLVSGSCGTGKTTISLEFLIRGAETNERGLYVSATEISTNVMKNMVPFGFFKQEYFDNNMIEVIDIPNIYNELGFERMEFESEDIEKIVNFIGDKIEKDKIQRLVIDSLTSICYRLRTEEKIRDFILKLEKKVNENKTTAILVSELLPSAKGYSQYGVEEAVADGIILLGNLKRRGDLLRTLQIIKMRGTSHSRAEYVMDITTIGILISPLLKGGTVNNQ